MSRSDDKSDLHLADFAERLVAFSVDYALFFLGAQVSLLALSRVVALPENEWVILWNALFLLYQAYASCEGRVSLGKQLLGLKVVTVDSEPLSLGQSVIRALAYIPGSVLSLGFLWSLISPNRQGWHDLAAGSYVVLVRPRRGLAGVRAAALGCLVFFGVAWAWQNVWAQRYYSTLTVAYAHVGMDEIALLQKRHLREKGRYAGDLLSLAMVSGDPRAFLRDMAGLYDLNGFEIKTSPHGYTVLAHARDGQATPVSFSGT